MTHIGFTSALPGMPTIQTGPQQPAIRFGQALGADSFQRLTTAEPAPVKFGSLGVIKDDQIADHHTNIRRIVGELETALTAGDIKPVSVPDKEQFLADKGINIWNQATQARILAAIDIVQVGDDPDNLYMIFRPAGKKSPVFSVYGLNNDLRISTGIRNNGTGDSLEVYFDVSASDSNQSGGVNAAGFWEAPVSYNSIDAGVFDEAQRIAHVLDQNNL